MIPTNSSFKFYQATKVYGTLFFQLPKVLLYSPTYKTFLQKLNWRTSF